MNRDDEIRSREQNRKFHAVIADIARQVKWAGEFMDPEDWKRIFLAAKYEQEVVPNPLDPMRGFVVRNRRRSRGLTVPEMADFITEIMVFGEEQGVRWADEQAAA